MTDWVAQDDWSQLKIGDVVRVQSEENVLTGRIADKHSAVSDHPYAISLQTGFSFGVVRIGTSIWQLSVPAKPAVELPNEPGTYISWVNPPSPTVVHKITGGRWVNADDSHYIPEEKVAELMPLILVEPVAVTAKKVIEFIESDLTCDSYDTARKEFGVSDD